MIDETDDAAMRMAEDKAKAREESLAPLHKALSGGTRTIRDIYIIAAGVDSRETSGCFLCKAVAYVNHVEGNVYEGETLVGLIGTDVCDACLTILHTAILKNFSYIGKHFDDEGRDRRLHEHYRKGALSEVGAHREIPNAMFTGSQVYRIRLWAPNAEPIAPAHDGARDTFVNGAGDFVDAETGVAIGGNVFNVTDCVSYTE